MCEMSEVFRALEEALPESLMIIAADPGVGMDPESFRPPTVSIGRATTDPNAEHLEVTGIAFNPFLVAINTVEAVVEHALGSLRETQFGHLLPPKPGELEAFSQWDEG